MQRRFLRAKRFTPHVSSQNVGVGNNMDWLNCGVTTQAEWPSSRKEVKYGDNTFVLLPRTKENSASIHIEMSGINPNNGLTLVNRFLSALAWKCDAPVINHYGWSGTSFEPVPVPRHELALGHSPFNDFPKEIYEITGKKTQLAIALYREARSLDSVPFQFLSYFKILNIFWRDKFEKGENELVEGLRSALSEITDKKAKKRINEIGNDPALYLYKSGRCAIAHAYTEPIVDPDKIDDLHRLSKDLWLLRQITAYLIEREFNIEQSIWK